MRIASILGSSACRPRRPLLRRAPDAAKWRQESASCSHGPLPLLTLQVHEWNNSHLVKGDLAAAVSKLKQQPGQDTVTHGSPSLIRSLLPDDLIDEYRLLIYPIALGRGKHLFDEKSQAKLSFAQSKAFGTGMVKLVYRRADKTQD